MVSRHSWRSFTLRAHVTFIVVFAETFRCTCDVFAVIVTRVTASRTTAVTRSWPSSVTSPRNPVPFSVTFTVSGARASQMMRRTSPRFAIGLPASSWLGTLCAATTLRSRGCSSPHVTVAFPVQVIPVHSSTVKRVEPSW